MVSRYFDGGLVVYEWLTVKDWLDIQGHEFVPAWFREVIVRCAPEMGGQNALALSLVRMDEPKELCLCKSSMRESIAVLCFMSDENNHWKWITILNQGVSDWVLFSITREDFAREEKSNEREEKIIQKEQRTYQVAPELFSRTVKRSARVHQLPDRPRI